MTHEPTVEEELQRCQHSALHLEMRDGYTENDPMLDEWRLGHSQDPVSPHPLWQPWLSLITETTGRGVTVRRARIVSEPVSEYIRYEFDLTDINVASGEAVRWLPRRQATGIALPGNDFWLFDNRVVLINHFDGVGDPVGKEVTTNPDIVELCATAFETVWAQGIPHADYRPT